VLGTGVSAGRLVPHPRAPSQAAPPPRSSVWPSWVSCR